MAGTVGTAPGTTTLQLPSGQVIQINGCHYAGAEWQNGDTSPLNIFSSGKSQPIVGGVRPQLRTDCNIPRNGDSGLPASWEFLVYSVGIELARATRVTGTATNPIATDISDPVAYKTFYTLNRSLYFEYKYNNRIYIEAIMEDLPSGSGAFWQGNTVADLEVVANGPPSPRDRWALVLPLDEQENLGYTMIGSPEIALVISQKASDAAGSPPGANLPFVDMRVKKFGLIKRNV